MALDGTIFGVYTREQIELFYPLFIHERDNGHHYNDPVRNQFRARHGISGLSHYNEFCKNVCKAFPDYKTNFLTLEALIEAIAYKEAEITIPEEEPKKRRCSIM